MATREGEFFRGLIGPLSFRVLRGKQIVSTRIAKGTMKQTALTIKSASTFGMAAKLAAEIKRLFGFTYDQHADSSILSRLTGVLNQLLSKCRDRRSMTYDFTESGFAALIGFEFANGSKVASMLSKLPVVSLDNETLKIQLPKLKIPEEFIFPDKSLKCKLTLSVALFRLRDGLAASKSVHNSLLIGKSQKLMPAQTLDLTIPKDCLAVVGLFMEYQSAGKDGWVVINHKELNPGCIVGTVMTGGKFKDNGDRLWAKMVRFKQKPLSSKSKPDKG